MGHTVGKRVTAFVGVSAVGTAALLVSLLWPPAFWVCGVGIVLLGAVVSIASIGRRKDWGYIFWLPKATPSLTYLEVLMALTAVTLVVVPLVVILVKDMVSR